MAVSLGIPQTEELRETEIILWLLHCDQHQNYPPALQTVTGQSIVSQWTQAGSCSHLLPRAQKHELLQRGLLQVESTKPLCTSLLTISCWHGYLWPLQEIQEREQQGSQPVPRPPLYPPAWQAAPPCSLSFTVGFQLLRKQTITHLRKNIHTVSVSIQQSS